MKVRTVKNMAVISLKTKVNDLRKVQSYAPEALTVKDEDGDMIFAITLNEPCADVCPFDGFSKYGAKFSVAGDEALIWIGLPEDVVGDKNAIKEFVKDKYGFGLRHIMTIEKQVEEAIDYIDDELSKIDDAISFAD